MQFSVVLLAFLTATVATADDRIFGDIAHATRVLHDADAPPEANGTLIMVMPDMAKNVFGAIRLGGSVPGVPVPSEIGVRGLLYAYRNEKLALAFEGFAQGYSVNSSGIFSLADAYGGGFRVELPVVSDGDNDALMVSPGVDFMFVKAGNNPGGWFSGSKPYTNVYFLGTNVDVSWLHMFARHFGIELGLQGGLDVSLGGRDGSNQETRGSVYPKLTMFGGFRF